MVRARSLVCAAQQATPLSFLIPSPPPRHGPTGVRSKAPNPNHSCLPRLYYSFLYLVA